MYRNALQCYKAEVCKSFPIVQNLFIIKIYISSLLTHNLLEDLISYMIKMENLFNPQTPSEVLGIVQLVPRSEQSLSLKVWTKDEK